MLSGFRRNTLTRCPGNRQQASKLIFERRLFDMQAWVIDSNMLQSDELRDYLHSSAHNFAVLPDLAWYEIYKQETLDGLRYGLSVVGEHPDQAILLRSGHHIAQLHPDVAEDVSHMVWERPLGDIRHSAYLVRSDAPLDTEAQGQLGALWAWARTLRPSLIEGAVDLVESFPEMQMQLFDRREIRIIRTSGKYTEQMIVKIFGAAIQIWETLAQGYELSTEGLSEEAISRTYLFRVGLGLIMYLLWWIRGGSQRIVRIDRASNDFVDLSFAVYATYFDGLMSRDDKALWVHQNLVSAIASFRNHYSAD